jgi:hypothetical protein
VSIQQQQTCCCCPLLSQQHRIVVRSGDRFGATLLDQVQSWKKLYLEEGKDALKKDRRGSTSKGRPRRKYDPEDIDSVMGRLAYLEAENDFLKKLHALADSKEKKSTR